jgi:hypothetical protein
MMHNCSLVSIAALQDKLQELIPIAEEAMGINDDSSGTNQIKLTALQLFRKILVLGAEDQDSKAVNSKHLDTFLPFILKSLTQMRSQTGATDMTETVNNMTVLKVEGLHTLTQIAI